MYNYQTKILIDKNYDFSQVKPDKQKQLTEANGYDFSLVDVVAYLKKQSKDFTEETDLLKDIDETIKNIVVSHHSDTQTPNPFVVPKTESTPSSQIEDVVNQVQEEIQSIKEAIDYLQAEADSGDEDAVDAIEYLKGELESLVKN